MRGWLAEPCLILPRIEPQIFADLRAALVLVKHDELSGLT